MNPPTGEGADVAELIYNNLHMEQAEAGLPTEQDYIDFESWKNDIGLYSLEEDIVSYDKFIIPQKSLFKNYYRLASWDILPYIRDSKNMIFYLVFNPKNKNYDSKKCFIDHVRKKIGKYNQIIITREIMATKVHYNVLVSTDKDLSLLNDKQDSRFYIYSKVVKNEDVNRVHQYIIKESKKRYFKCIQKPLDIFVQYKDFETSKFIRCFND